MAIDADPPAGTVLLNVCVLPDPTVAEACAQLSLSLAQRGSTVFHLGADRFAHMTMFMARFPESEIDTLRQKLSDAFSGAASFRCEATRYTLTVSHYAEVTYARTPQMDALHELLVDTLAPHRANPGQPFFEGYFPPYTDDQRHNAESTGYDLAHDLFRPHISLTRYVEGAVPNALPELPDVSRAGLSFDLSRIGLWKADNNGAVYEQLDAWTVDPTPGRDHGTAAAQILAAPELPLRRRSTSQAPDLREDR